MKLKFTIRYRTAWGESLHVDIAFHSQDGTVKHQDLVMQTADGELWTLEAAALVSRHHPLSHIVYRYQVENADGEVLRQEWDAVPRIYHFDASQDYLFPDEWHDRPLPYHLYSNAYQTTVGGQRDEQVTALHLPLFRRTVLFRVSAPQLHQGQSVAVCGSHPSIGSWNTSRYVKMEYAGNDEWMLTVNALGWLMPIEYKYVVVNDATHAVVRWEDGDNRRIGEVQGSGDEMLGATGGELPDGLVLVLHGGMLRLCEDPWRAAGVSVPVFALRSEHSYGVGDFGDLRRLVDWAVATGMKVIQVLPVNDTTVNGRWSDSCPYNCVSGFALHPHYVDLEAAGRLRSKTAMTRFLRRRQELNALSYSDYEAVDRVKWEYLHLLFEEQGRKVTASAEYKAFVTANQDWLTKYADYYMTVAPDKVPLSADFVCYVQFLLHEQLRTAADYARSKRVVLMGDLPVGMRGNGADARQHPELFRMESTLGVPPDAFSVTGQNWGNPPFNWDDVRPTGQDGEGVSVAAWMRCRLAHMQQYFDAVRIDHILGYFRVWEIPADAVSSVLGHFSPALPLTVSEIEYFGLPFRKELLTRPFINDRLVERFFGIHAQYVRENFLVRKAYNLYDLKEEFCTQRRVSDFFADRRDENSLWIRDGLMRLLGNVLFVEDQRQQEMYHPRIGATGEPVFDALSAEEKDAYVRLYNNYFFQRHSFFWGQQAMRRLPAMLRNCRMLVCGEDLGMLPDCVEPVLNELRILTAEVQQLPKQRGLEFAHLEANPVRSVCTITTHDMAPLRLWWMEQPERRQRYFVTMLQKEGRAPEVLPVTLAEEIIARHLYCPSMWCVLQLQDWLAMDTELRRKRLEEERVNVPNDAYNRWQYRMHVTIEELLEASRFNQKVKTMIERSKRA